MKFKIIQPPKLIALLSLILLTGCVIVPHTHISGVINGHPFEVDSPKDVNGLDINIETNGSAHIHLDSSKNSPDVISATGNAQAQVTSVYEKGFVDGLGLAKGALDSYLHAGGVVNISTNK